jgi:signal transduction histidine kinase
MHPLTHLSEASRRIAAGEQGVRVDVVREDEIGRLSQQFNSMIESVEAGRERQKQFAAEAAHELRTPVSLIQGTLEMMLEGVYPMSTERIAALHEEATRLADLVTDLRQLSASDKVGLTLEKTRLDLGEVVNGALALFEDQIKAKGVGVHKEIESGIWVLGDETRLQQVLQNLLHNALRYTPDGGTICVGCTVETATSEAIVSVRDTGPGIPEADREKVFERFYRVDGSRSRGSGGTGLGLAIAREIVSAHGGSIWVDSNYSDGTLVCFRIPVA